MSTKMEREWQALKPVRETRQKIEDIKEKQQLDDLFDELLKEVNDEQ